MKKKYILIILITAILTFSLDRVIVAFYESDNKMEEELNEPSQVKHENMLSMMLETDKGSGEYSLESRSTWPTKEDGYIFNSTLSKCEKGSKLRWDDENNAVVMVGTTSDKCYVYFDVYVDPSLANWVKNQYTGTQGENNLYYHDSTLANGAGDNSYRYAGSSDTTNNFVCFGSDAETCPDDNLYRIIGVFDGRVRLIKADYANSDLLGTDGDYYSGGTFSASSYSNYTGPKETINRYYWNNANYSASYSATGYYNDWSYSELNKTHLNKNFLANIGTTWSNMIDTTVWKVGGFASTDVVPSTLYTNEITSPSTQVTSTYESKVGLMYISDYAFAAAPSAWTTTPYNYDSSSVTSVNWMYMGLTEWTMARSSSYSLTAGYVDDSGWVGFGNGNFNVVNRLALGARPVFHLTSKIEVLEGDGTLGFPLKISDGA